MKIYVTCRLKEVPAAVGHHDIEETRTVVVSYPEEGGVAQNVLQDVRLAKQWCTFM